MHKSGFVNIIGNPNVGKSTLMNALVGEKLSIITSKAQTTRHRIMGIVNGDDFQIVYTDTPGIVNPHYKLHEQMMGFVGSALQDADLFLLVTEVGETLKNQQVLDKVIKSDVPVVLVINKVDTSDQATVVQKIEYWQQQIPRAHVVPCSATEGFNVEKIFDLIMELLPENPPYFPKDELTDRSMRFFVSEIVREKILLLYDKEIPYSCEVAVESYREGERLDNISAIVFVERESQKAILIGHQGKSIKKLGMEARKDIEEFTGKKCFLELRVKVLKDWRNSDIALRQFGYETESRMRGTCRASFIPSGRVLCQNCIEKERPAPMPSAARINAGVTPSRNDARSCSALYASATRLSLPLPMPEMISPTGMNSDATPRQYAPMVMKTSMSST